MTGSILAYRAMCTLKERVGPDVNGVQSEGLVMGSKNGPSDTWHFISAQSMLSNVISESLYGVATGSSNIADFRHHRFFMSAIDGAMNASEYWRNAEEQRFAHSQNQPRQSWSEYSEDACRMLDLEINAASGNLQRLQRHFEALPRDFKATSGPRRNLPHLRKLGYFLGEVCKVRAKSM
ncbi:hypothetical protein EVG20_g7701 [Dentipellis fragilis]|uniref:Uncharacterized protein n=1 Tax=Dentipellis fragilis TaxID=205917 RepID=A0A4Y9YAS7_9AGAM|nr:hypothetical protein EVG20_g7701 [Dentipellis fragilis]